MGQGNNIKKLTIITVIILSGIVALQFYWLLTSYQQQQKRFYSDIDNALATTNAKVLMDKVLARQPKEVRKLFGLEDTANGMNLKGTTLKGTTLEGSKNPESVHVFSSVLGAKDTATLRSLKKMLNSSDSITGRPGFLQIRAEFTDTDLVNYKDAYAKELKTRLIDIPFDLAVVDATDSIYAATCDTALFRKYTHRSAFNELSAADKRVGVVAGFRNPNYIVLRRMLWILLITLTLIILGSCSLGYLLFTFFRQGKIAEIRNDFMNNMTHELKTPISSISLAFEMALDEQLPLSREKRTSYLLSAQKETVRLKLIVENVLKILSLEKTGIDIIKSDISFRPWLETILDRINPLLEKREVSVRLDIQPETLVMYADETHMSNVIYNIVENAIKYNDKVLPVIKITADLQDNDVRLSIMDNGPGIPEKYISKVFDKFFRVPKGNQHDVKGYGLGLSYVKSVVELHGGSISVHSTPGKETEFIIHLPNRD